MPTDSNREFKRVPQYVKEIDGRKVTGVFSVFGNKDSYGDVAEPGSFRKTFEERGGKVLHLWQHDFYSPPTAVVVNLREIERGDLPEIVRTKYPEATGGATVEREYLDTPRGDEVLSAITKGVPLEMSYGYDAIRYEYEETEDEGVIRHLLEQRLWETSDVLWGANSATTVSKSRPSIPLDVLLGQIDDYLTGVKAGARHASTDMERINTIALYAFELGATSVKLVEVEEDEDSDKTVLSEIADAAEEAAGQAVVTKSEDGVITVTFPRAVFEMQVDTAVLLDLEEQPEEEAGVIGGAPDGKVAVGGEASKEEETEEVIEPVIEPVEEPEEEDRRRAEDNAPSLTSLTNDLALLELEV